MAFMGCPKGVGSGGGGEAETLIFDGYLSSQYYYTYRETGDASMTEAATPASMQTTVNLDFVSFTQNGHTFTFTFHKKCRYTKSDGTYEEKNADDTLTLDQTAFYTGYRMSYTNHHLFMIETL